MVVTIDRKSTRWRGPHVPTLLKALETGEPHFKMTLPPSKCAVCGRRFKPSKYRAQKCCSPSCAGKLNMRRRKA